ncbi:uncharacterized protein [Anabrus simplex]|uniref:uncharacterized protein n=1 Tax=Anabrus simplex TaxID=316456 RepID=UPI0035A2E418
MDLEVEIKEEPVWLEEKDNSSLEKFEFVSEMKPLKQETKSELRESVPTQDNALEPSPDIKEEISIEQNTVDEFVPHIEEENNVAEIDVFTVHSENGGNGSAVCGRSFTNEFSVSRHTVLAHSADVQPQCTVCDLTFTDRTSSHGQTFNRTQGGSQVSKGRSDGLTQSEVLRFRKHVTSSQKAVKKHTNLVNSNKTKTVVVHCYDKNEFTKDSTIQFKHNIGQSTEVQLDKKIIYKHIYQLKQMEIISLLVGACDTIPAFFMEFGKKFELALNSIGNVFTTNIVDCGNT